MKRVLLTAGGITALSLGIIGIFIPLLPTTPFLLLASACFLKSSERLYSWLTGHRLLGRYILCYQKHRALSITAKITTITLLWATIISSALLFISSIWVKALLLLIAIGVTTHLLLLKNLTPEMISEIEKADK